MIKKWIGSFALWVAGWKIELQGDKENLNRCVLVVAPHTTTGNSFSEFWLIGSSKNLSNSLSKMLTPKRGTAGSYANWGA